MCRNAFRRSSYLHTQEVTGSSPAVSTKQHLISYEIRCCFRLCLIAAGGFPPGVFTTQNGCMPERSGGAKGVLAICPFFVVKCGRRIFTYFAQGGYRGLIHQEADHDHLSGNACRNALRQDHRVCSGQTCGGQPQYVLLSLSGHLCPAGRLVSKTGGRP